MGNCHTVGPNKALVVSGGCGRGDRKRTIVGGWAYAWWCVTDCQKISLEVMTLNPRCDKVETAKGVGITVTGVAQVKVIQEPDLLQIACEQFLGKSTEDIKKILLQTLEGHLRAILGTLTVEEVYKDRDSFATLVRDVAATDIARMGIEILSFTIKDIYDNVNYLDSLGKTQTAVVKRDADIGVAESNRDATIREAECRRVKMEARYEADTMIADSEREFKVKNAEFDQEINSKKAEAELAYTLQASKEKQKIKVEEVQVQVVERKKAIEVEDREIARKEKELAATVKCPAEAQSYKMEAIAEGKRTEKILLAQAEAERIKLIGAAEAAAIEAIGKAEAEKMRQKAAAYKQYGDAAKMYLVLEAMPKMAAEVAAPLAKTGEIILLNDDGSSGNKLNNEVTKLVAQLPPTIQALTGVDLSKVLGQIPGAQTTI